MTPVKNNQAPFVLSEAELHELMRLMDTTPDNRPSRNRRKHVRYPPLLCRDTLVKVLQPGGGTSERLVTVRDLSAGGMSFLYPGYLHNGSAVEAELRKRMEGKELVHGRVRNCRHIHGVWHAVGIEFREAIFPQLFLSQSAGNEIEEQNAAKIDVSRLKGSILLVDDQAMDRNLFIHLLKGSSLRVTEAASSHEAIAQVTHAMTADPYKTGQFDLIVCDLNLGDVTGESAIAQIREKGFRGPMLVMTAETMPDRIAAALAAGGTHVLQKPYGAEKLYSAIGGQLGDKCLTIDDPIFSPLSTSPQNQPMVEKYVTDVRAMVAEMRKWIKEENLAQVRVICQSLKGTGAGYGFAVLTDVAAATLISLDASYSVVESSAELHRLDAICRRLRSAEPTAQVKPLE